MADEAGRPKFREVLESLTASWPPVISPDLLAALKGAQMGPAPDFSQPPPSLRVCPYCDQQHAASDGCSGPPMADKAAPRRYRYPISDPGPPPLPPLDPFTPGAEASAALAEMYSDMTAAGIPVASVESILGHMLAAYQLGKDQAE